MHAKTWFGPSSIFLEEETLTLLHFKRKQMILRWCFTVRASCLFFADILGSSIHLVRLTLTTHRPDFRRAARLGRHQR